MAKEQIELTPEQREKMTRENKKQSELVATIIWAVCSVIWSVLLVMDFTDGAAILQIVLHAICAVCNAFSAVLHFRNWRKTAPPSEQLSDSPEPTDTP